VEFWHGSVPSLLSFLLMVAAGWVNRHQLVVIEFVQAENQLLKQRLRGKGRRFSDEERNPPPSALMFFAAAWFAYTWSREGRRN
jgi:hypothetical protein